MSKSKTKKPTKTAKTTKTSKQTKEPKKPNKHNKKTYKTFKQAFYEKREKIWNKKRARLKLHHSFKRSYREDYHRELEAPGLVQHAMTTLKIIFKNWKLFLPLLLMIVALNIAFVGLISAETYKTFQDTLKESYSSLEQGEIGRVAEAGLLLVSTVTTGGLTRGMNEVQQVFFIIFVAITWLITIYFLRHLLAGNKPKFRDGVYNALAPLLSSLLMIALIFIHLIPIFVFVIVYSAAVQTCFLETPLYAFVFWLFSVLLILLSCYLLPVSITSLVAVTVPGIYPMTAINATTDLMQGRRTKFIIRILFSLLFIGVMWVIVMMPIMWLDLFLKDNIEWWANLQAPVASFFLQIMTTFSIIYFTAYIYLFYRRMLDDPN